jgi:hypothetical protein
LLRVGLFTELLPGKALIKSVTISLSSQETIVNIWKSQYDPRFEVFVSVNMQIAGFCLPEGFGNMFPSNVAYVVAESAASYPRRRQ